MQCNWNKSKTSNYISCTSQQIISWRVLSSQIWRRAIRYKFTHISEGSIALNVRIEEHDKQETCKKQVRNFTGLHDVTSQKVTLFIMNAARTSNPTTKCYFKNKFWEELIAYFPWYDIGHIENDASNNSSIVACICYSGNISTEPLPSNNRGIFT
jgi:hypothetical protein